MQNSYIFVSSFHQNE